MSGFEVCNVKDYGAVGDGVTDDTSAVQEALDDSLSLKQPLYFPAGTFLLSHAGTSGSNAYCLLVPTTDGLKVIGEDALVKFPSDTDYAFLFDANCQRVSFDGVRFEGDDDDDYTVNDHAAIYLIVGAGDVDVERCTFTHCVAVTFGSDGATPGRFRFAGNRCIDCPGGLSTPYRSTIVDNIFDCSDKPGERSHMIYIYGPADGCVISNNIFRRSDISKNAIQIRAGTGRYNHKHGFTITGNVFYECENAIWAGSDDTMQVSSFTITANQFYNCGGVVLGQGLRSSVISANICEWTWEFGSTFAGTAAINVTAGGPAQEGHTSNSNGVLIEGNKLVIRHPFFGMLTVDSVPSVNDTVTVGSQTYTWKTSPGSSGEIQIGGDERACAITLAAELRGLGLTPINKVLRDEQDSMSSEYAYDGAPTNVVVIASSNTFALSRTGTALTVTASRDARFPTQGILALNCWWPRISNNHVEDFGAGIAVDRSMAPIIEGNTLAGCHVVGIANVHSVWRSNSFQLTQMREKTAIRPYRWMFITDGFFVADGNTAGGIIPNEWQTIDAGSVAGTVGVGDGKARAYLYYGKETYDAGEPDAPHSLPWRWADGDEVYIDDGASTFVAYTFKRSAPGMNQFNTADGLVALINGSGTYCAAYVPYTDVGGTPDPKAMIVIKHVAGGTGGNTHRLWVTRYATVDHWSGRICGVILRDRTPGVDADFARFMGGAADATSTVVYSTIASSVRGVTVQGVDATAEGLEPIVYRDNIVPGVGFVITHDHAAGGEEFFFKVN